MIEAAVAVYVRHTRPWFTGLVAHGSAVKGGVIPGSSDLDLRLYLTGDAFGPDDELRWDVARAVHADLAAIDPAPFSYVQCVAERDDRATPLVPGTWSLLAGRCPARAATPDEVRAGAEETLRFTQRAIARASSAALETGDGRLRREVRLMATDVWPTVYAVLVLAADDPLVVWTWPKPTAVEALPPPLASLARRFHDRLVVYHAEGEPVGAGLGALDAGVAFLRAAAIR